MSDYDIYLSRWENLLTDSGSLDKVLLHLCVSKSELRGCFLSGSKLYSLLTIRANDALLG